MALYNITDIEKEALAEVTKEANEKAKKALVKKLKDLANAQQIVRNIEHDIEDLKASIADGSFVE